MEGSYIVVYGKHERRIKDLIFQHKLEGLPVISIIMDREEEWYGKLMGTKVSVAYGISLETLKKYGADVI